MKGFSRYSITGLYLMAFATCLLLAAVGFLSFEFWLFMRTPGSSIRGTRRVEIQAGTSALSIAQLLHNEGVISDSRQFYLLCSLRKAGSKLKAGEYAFLPLSTPDEVLDRIVNGRVIFHRVTVPEGSTVRDVAKILSQNGLASEQAIIRLARDTSYVNTLELSVSSLEGYLFPETYNLRKTQDERSVLKAMVRQFRLHYPEAWQKRSEELGLSVHDVVTIASLVEKEAVVDSERPLIAAVFMNRLERNMPLQSDPTTVYDLPGFSGPITWNELRRDSPYNTYLHTGLPAGPICNPGARSLEAVLYHANVPYLYFVSNNDGTHHFSESYEEHRQAVSRYRKMRGASSAEGDRSSPGEAAPQTGSLEQGSEGDAPLPGGRE